MNLASNTAPIWDDTAREWLNVPVVREALKRHPADVASEPAIHAGGHQTAGSSRAPGVTARSSNSFSELAGGRTPHLHRLPDRGARKHPASFLPARAPLERSKFMQALFDVAALLAVILLICVTVTCIISHRDGHFEENTLSAGRDESGNKNSIQAVGSTLTYLQRMTLKASLGLAASDDDDGASADVVTEKHITRKAYLRKLAGEVLTGEPMETYTNPHMERGKVMEDEARDLYAFMTDADPQRVGFIRGDNCGASPDSLVGDDGGLEIKTALPHIQIERLLNDDLPSEHKAQVHGCMWVTGRKWWDFVSYEPRRRRVDR